MREEPLLENVVHERVSSWSMTLAPIILFMISLRFIEYVSLKSSFIFNGIFFILTVIISIAYAPPIRFRIYSDRVELSRGLFFINRHVIKLSEFIEVMIMQEWDWDRNKNSLYTRLSPRVFTAGATAQFIVIRSAKGNYIVEVTRASKVIEALREVLDNDVQLPDPIEEESRLTSDDTNENLISLKGKSAGISTHNKDTGIQKPDQLK